MSFPVLTKHVTCLAMIPGRRYAKWPKYYVQTETLRLVLDAATARDAAVRAVQWCHDRHAEIYREPADDRIRDAEALEWQIGPRITVSEVGFDGGDGRLDESTRGRHWIVLHPARQIELRGTKEEVNGFGIHTNEKTSQLVRRTVSSSLSSILHSYRSRHASECN